MIKLVDIRLNRNFESRYLQKKEGEILRQRPVYINSNGEEVVLIGINNVKFKEGMIADGFKLIEKDGEKYIHAVYYLPYSKHNEMYDVLMEYK